MDKNQNDSLYSLKNVMLLNYLLNTECSVVLLFTLGFFIFRLEIGGCILSLPVMINLITAQGDKIVFVFIPLSTMKSKIVGTHGAEDSSWENFFFFLLFLI